MLLLCHESPASYVTPEDVVEMKQGIYVRKSVVNIVEKHKILDQVTELYNGLDHQNIQKNKNITWVSDKDNCINLYIDTKDQNKKFINQVVVDNEECLSLED